MKYNYLGQTGLKVSRIGFGVLTIGRSQMNVSLSEGSELIRYGFEKGIDFLDTAQYYETYPYIREALKDGKYQPVICSKSLDLSYDAMRTAVEEARREMDRDVIDIFLLHEVRSDPDWQMREGAWEYLTEAKAKGLVKAIGVSTHHVDVAEKMTEIQECDVLFPLINFRSLGIRRKDSPGTCEDMAAAIKAVSEKGKGVFAMKVFGGGNLTGDYLEALNYINALPGVDSMMIGFGYKKEIDDIVGYIDGNLSDDFAPDITHKKIRIDPGDCEGCGTCIKRCPNKAIYMNELGTAVVDHNICLTCGYCAPVCPVRAIIMF